MPRQFEAFVFTLLNKTFNKNILRLSLIALVLVFICSQTQTASHLHIDHHADVPCAVCIQTQDHPAAGNNAFSSLVTGFAYISCTTPVSSWAQTTSPSSYLSRAPPQS